MTLSVLSVMGGNSTGDPWSSRSPCNSVTLRRAFLRCLFNHLNARLKDPARLLARLPLPPCRSSLNTCSISGGIRSPTDSRPEDITPYLSCQISSITAPIRSLGQSDHGMLTHFITLLTFGSVRFLVKL